MKAVVAMKLLEAGPFDLKALENLRAGRQELLKVAAAAGEPGVLQIARAVSQRYAAGDKNIGIDVRDVMLQVMVRWGNGDDFQQVLNLYRHACYNQEDRRAALSALGYVSSPEYVKQVLDLVLSDEVEDGDVYVPLCGLRHSRAGFEEGWKWFKANCCPITFKVGECLLSDVIPPIIAGASTREQLEDIEDFFGSLDTSLYQLELEQELEKIQTKVAWVERDGASVEEWLRGKCLF